MRSVIIRFIILIGLLFPALAASQTQTLPSGWSMVGNDAGASIDASSIFGHASSPTTLSSSVITVWSWNNQQNRWNFFAPSMTQQDLSNYAALKGYGVLTSIARGEGFWVNAKNQFLFDPRVTANAAPVANAGVAQSVGVGSSVALDGSASSDANGDTLTYAWTLTAKPAGSTATLTSTSSATPSFTADVAGIYVASLAVNDGKLNSAASTIAITATPLATQISGMSADIYTTGRLQVGGSLFGNGGSYWYAITLNAGIPYVFALHGEQDLITQPGGSMNISNPLRLFNSVGNQVVTNGNVASKTDFRIDFTPSVSGTYYVSVQAYGIYSLSAASTGVAGVVPPTGINISWIQPVGATLVRNNSTQPLQMMVNLTAGQSYRFQVTDNTYGAFVSTPHQTLVRLVDSHNVEKAAFASPISYTPIVSDTYHLETASMQTGVLIVVDASVTSSNHSLVGKTMYALSPSGDRFANWTFYSDGSGIYTKPQTGSPAQTNAPFNWTYNDSTGQFVISNSHGTDTGSSIITLIWNSNISGIANEAGYGTLFTFTLN